MAAPRATQFIALRNLARTTTPRRNLHMTGPATYSSPLLTHDRSTQRIPQTTEETSNQSTPTTNLQTRRFNTSRARKAINDNSTIDFAFLPLPILEETSSGGSEDAILRVPILPTTDYSTTTTTAAKQAITAETLILQTDHPEERFSSLSADAVVLPMTDLSDGHAGEIDFHALADRVAAGVRRLGAGGLPVEEQAGIVKRIWSDLVDDVFGGKKEGVRGMVV